MTAVRIIAEFASVGLFALRFFAGAPIPMLVCIVPMIVGWIAFSAYHIALWEDQR